jgi:tRNA pseudouridine55 synthase
LFRAEKAGHTGSLDPLATGLLPLCFGEATKIAGHLLGNAKGYRTTAKLGITTDTDDADGNVLRERPVPSLSREQVETALSAFVGKIQQRPPIYSALKQGGEPLYAKARRGEIIEVPEREVEVSRIKLESLGEDRLELSIDCGSGTYVRSIVRDLGEALGCGAHVLSLRRTWVAPFRSPRMYALDELQAFAGQGETVLDACLLPVAAGLEGWPQVVLDETQASNLGHGRVVDLHESTGPGEVHALDHTGRSLGLAEVGPDGRLRARRLFRWAAAS